MTIAVLIVAAGRGQRAGQAEGIPKQYRSVGGIPVLQHCLNTFARLDTIAVTQVVIHPDDATLFQSCVGGGMAKFVPVAHGGRTRQESVRSGLEALVRHAPFSVLIHDAARPFVDAATIGRVLAALDTNPGAIAALSVVDTLKRASNRQLISGTVDRAGLWQAQTPQGFRFQDILAAHRRAAAQGRNDFTDDAAVAEWAGLEVALVEGSEDNFKLTTERDFQRAEQRMSQMSMDVRTGTGCDVHRFAPGDHVWLCGVKIPHSHGLEGHSDADVALHALTDAILGALGDGDIGQHFPPSDPKWKGAASSLFLADAHRRATERGARISNVDVTILCEAPRIGPYRDAMRLRISEILGLAIDRIGVKATTTEGLGFIGRREGMSAIAAATLRFTP